MRKVEQFSQALTQTREGYLIRSVVAVCDDGTVWRLCDNEAGIDRWEQLPSIPQGGSTP